MQPIIFLRRLPASDSLSTHLPRHYAARGITRTEVQADTTAWYMSFATAKWEFDHYPFVIAYKSMVQTIAGLSLSFYDTVRN